MLFIIQTALILGCTYSLVTLALFLSYRVLDIADLTTDGCFVLGMAVSVMAAIGGHPVLGLFLAMIAGGCAGFVTAFLQTRLGVPSILAGIVTNTGLYTINLMVMGFSSNASLLKQETVFTLFRSTGIGGSWYQLVLTGAIALVAMALMRWFLSTRLGLSIRATGDNREMVAASSINPRFTITVGLTVANCLTALSGGLVGQMQKSADINSGTGIVVIGLACLDHRRDRDQRPQIRKPQYHCLSCRKYYLPLHLCHHPADQDHSDRMPETGNSYYRRFGDRRTDPERKCGSKKQGKKGAEGQCLRSNIYPRPSVPARSMKKWHSTI